MSPNAPLACPYRPACPGCPSIGLPYPRQLTQKAERLAAALARYPHLELPALEPIVGAARVEGYRHRLKLPVQHDRDHGVRIGLYDGEHRVVHTPGCPVLAPDLREALPALSRWLGGKAGVHSVDLRVSAQTGELYLVVAAKGGELPGGARGARELRRLLPNLAGVAVSAADPEGRRVMGRSPRTVAGASHLRESIGATSYRLHPGAFFQVDPIQAERLHDKVRALCGDARTVLDLYAGVGAYGRMLAPGRARVVMVEEVPQAAAGAAADAPANVQVLTGKVEDRLPELARMGRFDVAVINPARRGSDPASLARLAGLVDRVVYVSCGPETLARDLDVLAAHGLRVASIAPIDLFPQTPEVETVVALTRGPKLTAWRGPGGSCRSPWADPRGETPSGAVGRPTRVVALVIGDTRGSGTVDGARYERIATVAGHSLVRIALKTTVSRALAGLRARGHPVAGWDGRTRAFFAEKAGLVRPFVHVEADADGNTAPLHGDLAEAVDVLSRAPASRVRKPRRRR